MNSATTLQRTAMLALVILAIALRLANLNNVAARTPDESVYTVQAKVWRLGGQAGLRELVAGYEADARVRQYPAPSRVGMIRLVAVAMEWTGRRDESAGAIVSCAASVASIVALALYGLRFFPPGATLFALLFSAVSPMELAISRRTWPDAILELAGTALVWIACEIIRGPRRYFLYPIFGVVSGAAVAVKEYSFIPCGICAAWVLWTLARKRTEWRGVVLTAAMTLAGTGTAVWWLGRELGGVSKLVEIVSAISYANSLNAYALQYASRPGYLFAAGFWIVGPVAALLSAVGLWFAFRTSDELRGVAIFWLVQFLLGMFVPHWLNVRYISAAYGAYYLLAGLGFERIFTLCGGWFSGSRRSAFALAAILMSMGDAWLDYQRFETVFVKDATPDLSIKFLLDERGR